MTKFKKNICPTLLRNIILFFSLMTGLIYNSSQVSAKGENDDTSIDQQIICKTNKTVYQQGEEVIITLINNSLENIFLIDRKFIDAGVGTIEKKTSEGNWEPITLYAAAAVSIGKFLKPGEIHYYVWQTVGHNRSDTKASAGTYRFLCLTDSYSNNFIIRNK